jgi:hypothetical protein
MPLIQFISMLVDATSPEACMERVAFYRPNRDDKATKQRARTNEKSMKGNELGHDT